jgi:hypothetical protein
MSDPLWESLPLLDLARKAIPVLEYLSASRRYERARRRREAIEALRRGRLMAAQLCPLHGFPGSVDGLPFGPALWCGCEWWRDVIYPDYKPLQVVRWSRLVPVTGERLVATFPESDLPLREDQLQRLRESFSGWPPVSPPPGGSDRPAGHWRSPARRSA